MWFTMHGQHDSRSRIERYTRSLSCRPSFLSQARENTPPVDADSWKPLFDFTVYGQWVRPVYEAVWLRNISGFTMCSVCLFSTPEKPFTESLFVWLTHYFLFSFFLLLSYWSEEKMRASHPAGVVVVSVTAWQTCSLHQLFPHRCDGAYRPAAATWAPFKKAGLLQQHIMQSHFPDWCSHRDHNTFSI